ncbi:TetR/AcrR family transcriptional regulator [Polyangium jinanense]|uniref:TetR/AcrR family transcriptional regulator n=1 Tax=Polyangium jinanense TaxID=2829994 RepID=UPI0023418B40|nr:TetR family transcriptional regulator [Polyangium jinanense]
MVGPRIRQTHGSETREVILAAAERLFAEHGVAAVSNRQVSEAAGQGNNFAVGYHFGTSTRSVFRFMAQVTTDPALRQLVISEASSSCTSAPSENARCKRGTPTPRATWEAAAVGLVDAIVGLWLAPVSTTEQ